MKALNEIKWGEFELSHLFDISSTKSGIDKSKLINVPGKFTYITRTDRNNGWENFIVKQDTKYHLEQSNVISIGLDTQTVFYQPVQFYTGQNIQVLSSPKINKYTAIFLIPLLKIQMEKFSWGGNGATLTRLKRQKLILPIDKSGEPDYVYMEQYMCKLEENKLLGYNNTITLRIKELSNNKKNKTFAAEKVERI